MATVSFSQFMKDSGGIKDTAASPSTSETKAPGFISRVGQDFSKRIDNAAQSQQETIQGKQGLASGTLQTIGQGAGAVGDVVTEGLRSIPGAKTVEKIAGNAISKIAETDTGKSVIQGLTKLTQDHPEAAKNIEAAINILSLLPIAKGASEGIEGAVNLATKAGKAAIGGTGDIAGGATKVAGDLKSKIIPKVDPFVSAVEDAKTILNPQKVYSAGEKEAAYAKGNIVEKGFGPFKKEVVNPASTPSHETLAQLVQDGKISTKNLPAKNISAIKQEARVLDSGIDEIVNRPDLNKPFNQKIINKVFENVKNSAKEGLTFVSDSTEHKAYNEVVDLAKKEIAQNPYNSAGLRKSIKAFNAKMERILGDDIYSGAAESIGNARVQAVKDMRSGLNNFLADNLESAPIKPNKIIAGQKIVNTLPSKSQFELGKTIGGSVYRSQLQKEAQLLNAASEIAFKSRGSLGKNAFQKFLSLHPFAKKVGIGVASAAGLGTAGALIK